MGRQEKSEDKHFGVKVKMLFAQSCLTLYDPINCSSLVSSVHGILQARILEWIAISLSRGFSPPRDRTQVSSVLKSKYSGWRGGDLRSWRK